MRGNLIFVGCGSGVDVFYLMDNFICFFFDVRYVLIFVVIVIDYIGWLLLGGWLGFVVFSLM